MRTTPKVWIEELRILKSWSLEAPEEVRRIPLRRGLNVIWAKTSDSGQEDLPGFGGHAAGKTSLCRLLRFVLGESHYGSRFMRDRILSTFENGWVLAKVWIGDTSWIVARPFRSGLHPKSFVSDSIESIFTSEQPLRRYEDFRDALHEAILAPFPLSEFPSENEPISFVHLLEWLARDQECRLSGLLDWRHESSHHGSPGMSAEQRRFLIRATLNFVDDVVRTEIEKRHKLELEIAKIPDESLFQKRTLRENLDSLKLFLKSENLPDVGESLFVDTVKRLALTKRENEITSIEQKVDALGLPQLREDLGTQNQNLGAKRYQESELQGHLNSLQTRFQEAQRDGTEAGYERFWDSLKPTDQFCRVPIPIARFRCPLRQEFEPNEQPAPLRQDLQAIAKSAQEEIQNLEANLKPITEARKKIETEVLSLQRSIIDRERTEKSLRVEQKTIEQTYTLAVFRAEQASEACQSIEKLERQHKSLETDIDKSKGHQETLQKRQLSQISNFSELYQSTLKAFLGSGIEASCKFTREEIDLKAEYHGELSSAAIDTLKTIAFDVAALRSGILSNSHHPGLIIFDSPREADMHPTPYQKIFHHIKSLETDENQSPFQVIITTTEPPPINMQGTITVVLELDASTKEGRVFKTDF